MIQSIYIENFMSISSANIQFDDSNIISLCGYNDSGKSAVIRLIDIMFYNAYSTEQVHYIKDGADFFKCIISFKDGVEYERIKYATGSSVFVLRKDGKTLFDNRKGNQIINTDGVPKVIMDYLGVIRDEFTKEELNVRRCTDRLFLIETTGGDNYKILNTILQSDRLAETSNSLNVDKNKLQQEIVVSYNRLSALRDERDRVVVSSGDSIDTFEKDVTTLEAINERFKLLNKINDYNTLITTVKIPDELSMIDVFRYMEIDRIKGYSEKAKIAISPEAPTISDVIIDKYAKLSEMTETRKRTDVVIQSEVDIVDIDRYNSIVDLISKQSTTKVDIPKGVSEIDIDRLNKISNLSTIVSHFNSCNNTYETIVTECDKATSELKKFADTNNLTICSNCGAVVSKDIGGHVHV